MSPEFQSHYLKAPSIKCTVTVIAIGSQLQLVAEVLSRELEAVAYKSVDIRISQLMHQLDPKLPESGPEDNRYKTHMAAGTDIRTKLGRGDALAQLAAGAIGTQRRQVTGDEKKPATGHAYIIRSLKHPDEVETLRNIYGRAFFVVAGYAPRDFRKERIAQDIAKSRYKTTTDEFLSTAEELIVRDEEESDTKFGQRLRDTFPLADVFVLATERTEIEPAIKRFVELVFGHPFHTPTIDEFAMFHARCELVLENRTGC
jgi:hypothetical protein